MLLAQRLVRIPVQDQAFKKRPIQLETTSFLDREQKIIDLGPELPEDASVKELNMCGKRGLLVITNENHLPGVRAQRGDDMTLQNFSRFFHQ
jgi:hypothetical protein